MAHASFSPVSAMQRGAPSEFCKSAPMQRGAPSKLCESAPVQRGARFEFCKSALTRCGARFPIHPCIRRSPFTAIKKWLKVFKNKCFRRILSCPRSWLWDSLFCRALLWVAQHGPCNCVKIMIKLMLFCLCSKTWSTEGSAVKWILKKKV